MYDYHANMLDIAWAVRVNICRFVSEKSCGLTKISQCGSRYCRATDPLGGGAEMVMIQKKTNNYIVFNWIKPKGTGNFLKKSPVPFGFF
jgi:hypothetical protein